jgi:hypothetical protein
MPISVTIVSPNVVDCAIVILITITTHAGVDLRFSSSRMVMMLTTPPIASDP